MTLKKKEGGEKMFSPSMTRIEIEDLVLKKKRETGYSIHEIAEKLPVSDLELYEHACKKEFRVEALTNEHLNEIGYIGDILTSRLLTKRRERIFKTESWPIF